MIAGVTEALAANGLVPRGGFLFDGREPAPEGPSGRPARTVLLVGQAGTGAWPHFVAWRARQARGLADPLDRWSREVIGAIAGCFGARAVSPCDRPYLPFQQWAMRAEGLRPSPLGILMHPEYGLWHAYRGALLFEREFPIEAPRETVHLCDECVGKPCLNACPAGAYSPAGFGYSDCRDHLRWPEGQGCMTEGCAARDACPHGIPYRYSRDQRAFHMASFARA